MEKLNSSLKLSHHQPTIHSEGSGCAVVASHTFYAVNQKNITRQAPTPPDAGSRSEKEMFNNAHPRQHPLTLHKRYMLD
jgi:hypothetical protein